MKSSKLIMMLCAILLIGCSREDLVKESEVSKINEAQKTLNGFYALKSPPILKHSSTDPDPYPKCDNIPTFSRPLNQAEVLFYSAYFPKLNTDLARITSISTKCYNCVAWTLGITNDWIWPDGGYPLSTEKSTKLKFFDDFYAKLGYKKVTREDIADVEAWGIDNGVDSLYMTHASVRYAQDRNAWESKLGELQRIKHFANELEGDTYGKVRAYYQKGNNMNVKQIFLKNQTPKVNHNILEYDALIRKIAQLDERKIEYFNYYYFNWKEEWFEGNMALSSNPADRKTGEFYNALQNMGADIIPLVVGRMLLYEDEFMALQLYNDLQKDINLRVDKNPKLLEGEKSKVNRTINLYLKSIL